MTKNGFLDKKSKLKFFFTFNGVIMKKTLFFIALLSANCFSLFADVEIDPQNIGDEKINQPANRGPFSLNVHADGLGSSEINNSFYKKDKVDYAEALAEVAMVVYYNPTYIEGARVSVGYSPTYLNWHGNPWFNQSHFNFVPLSVTGFSKRIDHWFWRTQLTANFDTDSFTSKYTSYDLLLWGRYDLCENIGIHIGFWAETGLKLDRIYPIFGFDWQITKNWKLNLVFPTNLECLYILTPKWSLGVAGRFFDTRFRVRHKEYSYKPLVRYTNMGLEFIIKYDNDLMSANLHAGSTMWGRIRVADSDNDHAKHYFLNSAAYVGAEVDVKF